MNIADSKEKCSKCGAPVVYGYMYDGQFIYGDTDLQWVFRKKEYLLKERFPDGIPVQGNRAKMCVRCYYSTVV